MKFRKFISITLASTMLVSVMTSCSSEPETTTKEAEDKPATTEAEAPAADDNLASLGLDENLRFTETRKISVEVYDRNNDGGSNPEDNFYTNFIKEGMLRDHNVEVTFVPVPRWTEVEEINNLLAAGDAPDICVTYNYPTVQTYATMGGVLDINTYLSENEEMFPNLFDLLQESNVYWNQDPSTGTIWALEARLKNNARQNTFIREDWLKTLGLEAPTTLEEFENVLYAFRDNADVLLGADADKMIPFSSSYDLGYRGAQLIESYTPNVYSDYDKYVKGYDDRHMLYDGTKEGVRKLNQWYNEDLMWNDFAIYPAGDQTEENYFKAGYVGAFTHNWDFPYRNGEDSVVANMKRLVGEEANYIAVEPFMNEAGVYKKYLPGPIDRKIFFPSTNDEPVASLLYLDWLSNLENRMFLQIGEEGVTHEVMEDGSIKTIAVTDDKIMNSPLNIDYTIVINGLDLGDPELTLKSMALSYAGIDPSYIERAYQIAIHDGDYGKNVNVGTIESEMGQGPALILKRDTLLCNAVVATPDKFDSVYDKGMEDYLASGGQAIIDEREQKWKEFFGDATMLPSN